MKARTEFEACGVACPRCGEELADAEYVRYRQSDTVGKPVGYVPDETLASWKECVECGWLSADITDLPQGARSEWLDALA